MDESKTFTLILTQIFIFLGLVIAVLSISVFYLRKKAAFSSSDTADLHADAEDASIENQDESPSITNTEGNDAWMLKQFLEKEIDFCAKIYQSLSGDPIPEKAPTQSEKKLITIFVRHTYLKAELDALEFRNDPGPFWDSLIPILIKLCATIPSESIKKIIKNIKHQHSLLEKENKRLSQVEEIFFELQKLLRDCLPENSTNLLLPLTEEIELLNTASSTEEIISHYKDALTTPPDQLLKNGHVEQDESSTNVDLHPLNKIAKDQADNISILEGFLAELHEQNTLPSEQMDKYHNFILNLKGQLNHTNQAVSGLERKLGESEMCTHLLESELEAAQETIKGLMTNIEDSGPVSPESGDTNEKVKDLEELVDRFTTESRDMLMSIQMLQDENSELRNKIDGLSNS